MQDSLMTQRALHCSNTRHVACEEEDVGQQPALQFGCVYLQHASNTVLFMCIVQCFCAGFLISEGELAVAMIIF